MCSLITRRGRPSSIGSSTSLFCSQSSPLSWISALSIRLFLSSVIALSFGSLQETSRAHAQVSSQEQRLNWQVLGDIALRYPHTSAIPSSFTFGDIDLWFQRSFGERWNALGELILMNTGDHYMIHPARLFLEYSFSETLRLRVGQIHTPIGLYSQLYPHGGKVFEPTLNRPRLAGVREGEDILPFHSLGVTVRGSKMISDEWELMYIAGIGNGYNHGILDDNHQKSPLFQLRLSSLSGLSFALSGYHDLITRDEIKGGTEQSIFALSVLYDYFPFNVLFETFVARHASTPSESFKLLSKTDPNPITLPDGTQPRKQLYGGYLILSYLFEDTALFGKFEIFERDGGDYLFDEHVMYTSYMEAEVGARYHWSTNIVFKSAYSYQWIDALHRLELQLAFRL